MCCMCVICVVCESWGRSSVAVVVWSNGSNDVCCRLLDEQYMHALTSITGDLSLHAMHCAVFADTVSWAGVA
jgi:hypothetical protein